MDDSSQTTTPTPPSPASAPASPASAPASPAPVFISLAPAASSPDSRAGGRPRSANISVGALADAFEALQVLADQPLPGAASAGLVRLSRWAHPHYVQYIGARTKAAKASGKKSGTRQYQIPAEKVEEFNHALVPIRAELVAFDPALRVSMESLADARISPVALVALRPFLTGL